MSRKTLVERVADVLYDYRHDKTLANEEDELDEAHALARRLVRMCRDKIPLLSHQEHGLAAHAKRRKGSR